MSGRLATSTFAQKIIFVRNAANGSPRCASVSIHVVPSMSVWMK